MSKISLNESTGAIFAGGSGDDGDLILKDAGGRSRIHLDGGDGSDPFKEISFDGQPIAQAGRRAYVDGKNAELKLGSNGRNGKIKLELTAGDSSSLAHTGFTQDFLALKTFKGHERTGSYKSSLRKGANGLPVRASRAGGVHSFS